MTDDEIYDRFGPEEFMVSAACMRQLRPGSVLSCPTKDLTTWIAYTVIAIHPLQSTCLAPGAGVTVMHCDGTLYELIVREGRLKHCFKLVLR
jgi:hypothetical protein